MVLIKVTCDHIILGLSACVHHFSLRCFPSVICNHKVQSRDPNSVMNYMTIEIVRSKVPSHCAKLGIIMKITIVYMQYVWDSVHIEIPGLFLSIDDVFISADISWSSLQHRPNHLDWTSLSHSGPLTRVCSPHTQSHRESVFRGPACVLPIGYVIK